MATYHGYTLTRCSPPRSATTGGRPSPVGGVTSSGASCRPPSCATTHALWAASYAPRESHSRRPARLTRTPHPNPYPHPLPSPLSLSLSLSPSLRLSLSPSLRLSLSLSLSLRPTPNLTKAAPRKRRLSYEFETAEQERRRTSYSLFLTSDFLVQLTTHYSLLTPSRSAASHSAPRCTCAAMRLTMPLPHRPRSYRRCRYYITVLYCTILTVLPCGHDLPYYLMGTTTAYEMIV